MPPKLGSPEYCARVGGHQWQLVSRDPATEPRCLRCGVERNPTPTDEVAGRRGEWMQTSSGGRFFPLDPRPEDFNISDIANGLALDCRYGGQGRVDRFYSVAEHSVHMADYALRQGWGAEPALAVLLHDAAEAFLNDLTRAVKHAVGAGYERVEAHVSEVILEKYGVRMIAYGLSRAIKTLDQRIVPLEKAAIMRHPQPWAHDKFEPLDGVVIQCWEPRVAKAKFLFMYERICALGNLAKEECCYE